MISLLVNSMALSDILSAQLGGDIVRKLYPFFQSKIRGGVSEFCEKHASDFDPDDDEHKLIHTDIFHEYEALLESYLEEFAEENNLEKKQFYKKLERASKKKGENTDTLLKMIIAQSDFSFFVSMMKDKARA